MTRSSTETERARTGARALIDALAAQGTRHLFGIPGVHTLLPFDLLDHHPTIRPVVTRHEGGAGFAADGYARAGGQPGVCLVVPGPGATNLTTAALVALSDRVPLVLITATVPARLAGRQAVHESNLEALYRPLVKAQLTVERAGDLDLAVARAFALALSAPAGPVQLAIPYDLFGQPAGAPVAAGTAISLEPHQPLTPPEPALERALALLSGAKAPLIYAGHGVVSAGAGPALVALAEALGAPVLTSNKARGVIPEDHRLAAGIPSMAGAATLARAADVCLALGTRFNEYTTLTWKLPLPRRLIRVDHDPAALERNYPAELTLGGDVALVLDWLLERLPPRPATAGALQAELAALRHRRQATLDAFMVEQAGSAAPFHPRFVARALRQALPANALLTSDGSATESWLYEPGFVVSRPGSLLVPEIQQTMGYAVGAALGAALAAPERPVVAVIGDGSLTMTLGELATLAAERVPLTVVVFNDGCYNALRVRQEAVLDRRYVGTLLGDLDYAQVARGLGLAAERVTTAEQLRARLADAAAPSEPILLDVPTSPAPLSERYAAVVEAGG